MGLAQGSSPVDMAIHGGAAMVVGGFAARRPQVVIAGFSSMLAGSATAYTLSAPATRLTVNPRVHSGEAVLSTHSVRPGLTPRSDLGSSMADSSAVASFDPGSPTQSYRSSFMPSMLEQFNSENNFTFFEIAFYCLGLVVFVGILYKFRIRLFWGVR